MPGGRSDDDAPGAPPPLRLGQRLVLLLPRFGRRGDREPFGTRLKDAMLKPVEPDAAARAKADDVPLSLPELEEAVASANDKERLTGLLLAPVAAALGIIVTNIKVADDPSARLANGHLNPLHQSVTPYHTLALVFLVLALLMLGFAYYRKRLLLGVVMALYGLSMFNLPPNWGFGIPYLLAGAWLLVRAYRLQRDLKEATAGGPGAGRRPVGGRDRPPGSAAPRVNKRYTP
ncbi:MAG: hypothetical protein ACRDY1_16220, partial [Acidimicrobiales bacterium]